MNSIFVFLILISIVLTFVVCESSEIHKNDIPRGDEAAFLETANSIRENGGPYSLISRMFSGDYREANRHPLYVWLISIFAKRELSFYEQAKVFTSFIALIYIFIIFYVTRQLRGTDVALLTSYLWVVNRYFLEHSAKISTEPLLMIFILVAWYMICEYFYKNQSMGFKQGVSVALAYLSKITGIFILPSFVITAIACKKKRFFSQPLFFFILGFVLVSLPLLWRNTLIYKNPFYNYNSNLLWIESSVGRKTVSLYEGEQQRFYTFISRQSLPELFRRVIDGLVGEAVVISQILFFSYARIRGAIFIAIIFLSALYRDRNKNRAIFSCLLVFFFYFFFSWYYKISGHYRYIIPVIFIFYFYLVNLFYLGLKKISQIFISKNVFRLSFKISLLFLVIISFLHALPREGIGSPFGASYPTREYLEVKNWVAENVNDDLYLNGPGHDYQVGWLTKTSHLSFDIPATESFQDLAGFIENWDIRYVILSEPAVTEREKSLGRFFSENYELGIFVKEEPPGWDLVLKDASVRPRYLIYKISLNEK